MSKRVAFLLGLLFLALSFNAPAATIVDLGLEQPPPIPAATSADNQPVYITTSQTDAAIGEVEYLSIASGTAFHLGYDSNAVAQGDMAVTVNQDVTVAGIVNIGKDATPGAPGVPETATNRALSIDVGGDMRVEGGAMSLTTRTSGTSASVTVAGSTVVDGGSLQLHGAGGTGETGSGLASLTTDRFTVGNGIAVLGNHSILTTTYATDATAGIYTVDIGGGGRLILNSGLPVGAGAEGMFYGVDVSAGGHGLRVGQYGTLAAGSYGGVIRGSGTTGTEEIPAGQRLVVDRDGVLDLSAGNLRTEGIAAVDVAGTYLAGYNETTATANSLTAVGADVTFSQTSAVTMTRDLQREMNRLPSHSVDNASILAGDSVVFELGRTPTLQSALGTYSLSVGASETDALRHLYVSGVTGAVTGFGDGADQDQFKRNLSGMWSPGQVNRQFADNIYNLSVNEVPTIVANGPTGELNQAVYDAFINGRMSPIGQTGGMADDGVFEFYAGANQFGPANAAYNTVSELSGLTEHRINQVQRDGYYRLGDITAGDALASYDPERLYGNRFWAGGFGRKEEANLDYGIAGYKYDPSGLVLGYDRIVGPFMVGAVGSYGKGDYEDKAALANSSTISSYSAGIYAGIIKPGGLRFTSHAAYSRLRNDLSDERGGLRREADYHTDAWSFGARIGYELFPAERLTITPSIGVDRIHVSVRGHDEHFNDQDVYRVGTLKRRSTMIPIDLGFGYDLFCEGSSMFRLTANIGYAYDFDNDGLTGTFAMAGLPGSVAVPIAVREPGRNRFNFGAGFLYSGSKLDVTGRYDYFRRAGQHAHTFKGALGVKF